MTDLTQTTPNVDDELIQKMLLQRQQTKERQAKHYKENKQMLLERRQKNRVKARERLHEKYESGELERPKRGRPPLPPELKKPRRVKTPKPPKPKKSPKKRGAPVKRIFAKASVVDGKVIVTIQNPTGIPIEYKYKNTPEVVVE